MLRIVGNDSWWYKRHSDPCLYRGEHDRGFILDFYSLGPTVLPAFTICDSSFAQPTNLPHFRIKSPLVSSPKTYREAIPWDLGGTIHKKRCLELRVTLCWSQVQASKQKGSLCVLHYIYWVRRSVCYNCDPLQLGVQECRSPFLLQSQNPSATLLENRRAGILVLWSPSSEGLKKKKKKIGLQGRQVAPAMHWELRRSAEVQPS